jgi:hypothetical protein
MQAARQQWRQVKQERERKKIAQFQLFPRARVVQSRKKKCERKAVEDKNLRKTLGSRIKETLERLR